MRLIGPPFPFKANFTFSSADSRSKIRRPRKFILAFIAVCAIAKLFALWMTGFTGDEAYTVVISRSLQLSYFDHPPLHQWIVHGFAALFGEGWWLCIPFLVMAEAVNIPLYGMTRRLFGRDAALWALFGFNATAYFVVWPDGLILPDVPLFLFLAAGVWAIAEILFGPTQARYGLGPLVIGRRRVRVGRAFEICCDLRAHQPVRISGFLAPAPALVLASATLSGCGACALIFSPALIWNYQNNWVSFAFQSGRAATGASLGASAFASLGAALGAQIALLSPWVGSAARHRSGGRRANSGRR